MFIKYFFIGLFSIIKSIIYLIKYSFIGIYTIIYSFIIGASVVMYIFPHQFINGFKYIFITQKTKLETITVIFLIICLCTFFFSIYTLSSWINQSRRILNLSKDIIEKTTIVEKLPNENSSDISFTIGKNIIDNNNKYYTYNETTYLNVDFTNLLKENEDTVGWIKINNTNVNYPIVQTTNNNYYLTHSFDKKINYSGWIFGDYRNDLNYLKRNTIIYGHNVLGDNLFGTIPKLLKETWQNKKENHYIKISTPKRNMIWQVFSIYVIEPETYYLRTFFNNEDYQVFIDTIKNRSIYNFEHDINISDYILTLSTCDNSGKKRIVVHAKLLGIKNK